MKLWQKIAGGLVVAGVAATPIAADKLDKYEVPPAKTQFEQTLDLSENRGLTKADALSKVKIKRLLKKEGEFSLRGIDVRIINLTRVGERLKVDLTAEKDGKKLKLDTPYWYVNPPVKVPTGKFHKELIDDEEVDVANFEVNLEEALKEIIVQTIELQTSNE